MSKRCEAAQDRGRRLKKIKRRRPKNPRGKANALFKKNAMKRFLKFLWDAHAPMYLYQIFYIFSLSALRLRQATPLQGSDLSLIHI